MAARAEPARMLEAGVMGLALAAPRPDDPHEQGVRLVAGLPLVAAAYDRLRQGLVPVDPRRGSGSIAASFLAAWRGTEPEEWETSVLDRSLVLVADHELNASTFAARVAASTGADLAAAVLAGVVTYCGPLHGGALRFTGELLAAATPDAAAADVVRRLDAGERIPGFGHPVYRRGDPRVPPFRALAEEVAAKSGERRHLEAADRIEEIVTARTGRAPNMDLPAAACWRSLGIPAELLPAIFAIGRMAGWVAHVLEQAADNRLIRPRARYAGLTGRAYEPIEERG
jgi:citrate synthase